MIAITPQMRILVAVEAVDGRKGIDGLTRLCQEKLQADPFSGCLDHLAYTEALSLFGTEKEMHAAVEQSYRLFKSNCCEASDNVERGRSRLGVAAGGSG
jgi:hypothetical protein